MKVTIEGKQHLGAVIGSEAFKISDAKSFVHDWIKKLKIFVHNRGIRTTIFILSFC